MQISTSKWWNRIFQLLIEFVQVNSYIIYTLTRDGKIKRKAFKKFKEQLAEDLCSKSYTFDALQTEEET